MHEPPSGGYDLRTILTEDEYKMEQICDEERYRSLYNNEVEEAINHGNNLINIFLQSNTEVNNNNNSNNNLHFLPVVNLNTKIDL